MVLKFDEETLSFPCRKCGHLFYSTEALEITTTHPMEMISVFPVEIAIKSSAEIDVNFFMKGIAQVSIIQRLLHYI